jgi:hypothetical protein
VASSRSIGIADRIQQVIWGEFRAYRDWTSTEPIVRIVAFDSSYFEVWCDDAAAIGRVRASFKNTELISP